MQHSQSCAHSQACDVHDMCIAVVPIFNHLTAGEMKEIVKTTVSVTLKHGETLYNAGDQSNSLYIIHKGKVKVYRLSDTGKEQLIRILEPGDFTGELALFSESIHDTYAETMEKTEICRMNRPDLHEFLEKYPSVSLKILKEFSSRLAKAEMQAMSFATEDTETRLALYLAEQSEENQSLTLTLPMSKKDLASYLGTTPETISRRLAQFEDEGWIKQQGQRKIKILDLDALLLV